MSDLENRAKPLILRLIRGKVELRSLVESDRHALARWAGKTAIIESHAIGAECPVDKKHLRWIRTRADTPGRFCAAACRTHLIGFGHLQAGIITDLLGGGKAAGNIIVIALPKLAFTCAFSDAGNGLRVQICEIAVHSALAASGILAADEPDRYGSRERRGGNSCRFG